ncbi:phage portal protein [Clostridia bacterium]|nr:phage portal protein [Clostridia bacterium]
MGNLMAFLAQNAIQKENVKLVVSDRFVDEKGKPIEWEIRCLTAAEDEELRRQCTKIKLTKGRAEPQFDANLYMTKLAAACTVYPDLNSAELQDSYGAMGDAELLKKLLYAGEINSYVLKIQEVNGFNVTLEDKVDKAKN